MTEREAYGATAVLAAAAILAGPRRTRPLAGFVYGLVLSRAQGASRRRLEKTVGTLFAQRRALSPHVDALRELADGLEARVEELERLEERFVRLRDDGAHGLKGLADRVRTLEACFGGDPAAWQQEAQRVLDRLRAEEGGE